LGAKKPFSRRKNTRGKASRGEQTFGNAEYFALDEKEAVSSIFKGLLFVKLRLSYWFDI
jgi:hypothetical protein